MKKSRSDLEPHCGRTGASTGACGWLGPATYRKANGIEKLVRHPATKPDEINLFEIDTIRAGFDKPARIVSTEIVRGVKGLQKQMQFASVGAAQLIDAFRQNAVGETWQAIEDVQWPYDQKAGASILTIIGTGNIKWDDGGGGAKSIDAATAQRDNVSIAAFDNSMGWISYDPSGKNGSVGNGETVPATYESDWKASGVSCASPAKFR